MEAVDQLNKEYKYKEAFDAISAEYEKDKENPEVLWRLGRAHYFVAENLDTDNTKKHENIQKGVDYTLKASEIDDKCALAFCWYSVCLGSLNPHISTKEKIGNAMKVKHAAEKSYELDPTNEISSHTLGVWCFNVAGVTWMEKKIASALFGTPPKSTYEEALGWFEKAQKACPDYKKNSYKIAECYYQLSRYAEAKEQIQKCLDLGAKNKAHENVDALCKALLKKC